jgi:hypothetical protein
MVLYFMDLGTGYPDFSGSADQYSISAGFAFLVFSRHIRADGHQRWSSRWPVAHRAAGRIKPKGFKSPADENSVAGQIDQANQR